MSRLILLPLIVIVVGAAGGCGLLVLPLCDQFPKPVKGIQVMDCKNGCILENATVSYRVVLHESWEQEPPRVMTIDPFPLDGQDIPVRRDSRGIHRIEKVTKMGLVQLDLLTPAYYRNYEARIKVDAPGYYSLVMFYSSQEPPNPGWKGSPVNLETDRLGYAEFAPNGILKFKLSPKSKPRRRTATTFTFASLE